MTSWESAPKAAATGRRKRSLLPSPWFALWGCCCGGVACVTTALASTHPSAFQGPIPHHNLQPPRPPVQIPKWPQQATTSSSSRRPLRPLQGCESGAEGSLGSYYLDDSADGGAALGGFYLDEDLAGRFVFPDLPSFFEPPKVGSSRKTWSPPSSSSSSSGGAVTTVRPPSYQQGRRPVPTALQREVSRKPWQGTAETSKAVQEEMLEYQREPYEMLRLLRERAADCNHVNIITALHRCGKLGSKDARQVGQELIPLVEMSLSQFTVRQLCNSLWALAKLRLSAPQLTEKIVERLMEPMVEGVEEGFLTLHRGKPSELAMALWGVVASGVTAQHVRFLEEVSKEIQTKVALCGPREISMVCWALAVAVTGPCPLNSRGTATPLTSNDGRKWVIKPVLAMVERVLYCHESLTAKDIAMLTWSMGKLCPLDWATLSGPADMLATVLSSAAVLHIRSFSPTDLAQLAVGVVHLQYDNKNLMQLVAYESTRKLHLFSEQELANVVWAFAKVFRRPRKFVVAAAAEAQKRLNHFNEQELANLAWALCILEVHDVGLYRDIFSIADRRLGNFEEQELNQLYQVYLVLKRAAPEAVSKVSSCLLREMEDGWRSTKHDNRRITARQQSVSQVLSLLRVDHVIESRPDDIDILLVDENIALEVDGPSHFLRNSGHPMGHTIMKRRLLTQRGYKVVTVPHFEWDRIPNWASMELKRYLQRKCNLTEVLHFSAQDFSRYQVLPPRGKKTRHD